MGLPMRYPRFLIVLFVVLGLAAPPAVDAYAADADALPGAIWQIETTPDTPGAFSTGKNLARRGRIVELLAMRVDLDAGETGRLLDAVAALVVSVTGTGERAGVLASPEIDVLLEMVLGFIESIDPQSDQGSTRADVLAERAKAATELLAKAESAAMDASNSTEIAPDADPVERWRPLVERHFSPERVEEALSIIECESNGDPNARNSRSSAAGLFQFLDRTWSHSSEQAGFQGESPFSPEANVAAAAWLVEYSLDGGGSAWEHWTCRP